MNISIKLLKIATREMLRLTSGRDPGRVYPRHFLSPTHGRLWVMSGASGGQQANGLIVHFVPGKTICHTCAVAFMLN